MYLLSLFNRVEQVVKEMINPSSTCLGVHIINCLNISKDDYISENDDGFDF